MTSEQLVEKLDRCRADLSAKLMTPEQYLSWVADIFDGSVGFALNAGSSTTGAPMSSDQVEQADSAYAGRVDAVGWLGTERVLIDRKTDES